MKRMIIGLVVLMAVAGALSFTRKDDNFCLYVKNSPSTCPLTEYIEDYNIISVTGGIMRVQNKDVSGNCTGSVLPSTCIQIIEYTVD